MLIKSSKAVLRNLPTPLLYEEALLRGEARLARGGGLVVTTGKHTGRSPNDKFIVQEPSTGKHINWGSVNQPMGEEQFTRLHADVLSHLGKRDVFVQECSVGVSPYIHNVAVVSETAWHSLFARIMFRSGAKSKSRTRGYTILHAPSFDANPKMHGTRSSVAVVFHFKKRVIIIAGTSYAGEIKKGMFTVLNYLLPRRGVLSLHSGANVGKRGDVALFFGLSGTGKTTLSTDSERLLIGDDEIAWGEKGVFNQEGGSYAKMINLSQEAEPEVYAAAHRFGAVLENVVLKASREIDFANASLTENTRAAYPLSFLDNVYDKSLAPHPSRIFMLTADAFGVLPPVARLDTEQAIYHFLSGYTSKLAGTEKGITEPEATFSPCFGAPFMPLAPAYYAKLLREKILRHKVSCWLVNTGWVGGSFGKGKRISIAYSRAIVRAILNGKLEKGSFSKESVFELAIPRSCPGVPSSLLNPRSSWKNKAEYDKKARELSVLFEKNASL